MTGNKRAALYLRVSTDQQTTENQRRRLMQLAELRDWTVVKEYEDAGISGAKGRDKRPAFDAMMQDAKRRRFDLVMVWSVNRLGRATATVATAMTELDELGVGFYADKEGMDSTTAHGRAMLQMAAVFGELERAMIRQRVQAGMDRVKATGKTKSGKPIGRPAISADIEQRIRDTLAQGNGILKTAKLVGAGNSTVQRVKDAMARDGAVAGAQSA
ncbi:MAG: recombinase family protein [Rhodopila sp.]|jgi:DNA invertase Pin-like site-specific DNA recombinase